MKLRSLLLNLALLAFATVSASAAMLGDPGGPLVIKDWVKGGPVDVKDGKNIYVIEFWATWCGPCKVSIPHLTDLQKKFKDKGVIFVGVSDENAGTVKPFVERMGARMDYIVACDKDRATSEEYMTAYAQNGIPTAFVVGKDGRVLWFGHPMGELEQILDQIISGQYDAKGAAKKHATRATLDDYQRLSTQGDAKAKDLGQTLLNAAGNDVNALTELAFNIAANIRNQNRDLALANQALDRAEKVAGRNDARILGTRSVVCFESGKEQEGLVLAKQALKLSADSASSNRYANFVRVMEARLKQKAANDKPAK
jgi:thiol-disulfide isomerase/thioredoxin